MTMISWYVSKPLPTMLSNHSIVIDWPYSACKCIWIVSVTDKVAAADGFSQGKWGNEFNWLVAVPIVVPFLSTR